MPAPNAQRRTPHASERPTPNAQRRTPNAEHRDSELLPNRQPEEDGIGAGAWAHGGPVDERNELRVRPDVEPAAGVVRQGKVEGGAANHIRASGRGPRGG